MGSGVANTTLAVVRERLLGWKSPLAEQAHPTLNRDSAELKKRAAARSQAPGPASRPDAKPSAQPMDRIELNQLMRGGGGA